MKLHEIADDMPLQLILLKDLLEKHIVYTWLHMYGTRSPRLEKPKAEKVKGVVIGAGLYFDKRNNKSYIGVGVDAVDDSIRAAMDIQRYYPSQWDTMQLTDKLVPGEWWLIDTGEPDEAV